MRLILWKEWRDNRLTLLATGLLILLTLGILGFWDQGTFLREQDAAGAAATVAGWSTWMFLTCSLFGPEWHRKHALWLARTPWGLGRAWASKVVFATFAALGMGLWAWLVTKGVIAALGIPVSQARYELMVQVEAVWVLGLVGTWLIAASCWGLRPGFVLFVAPAAAIGFNAPYLGALLDKHWSFPPPTGWDFLRSAAIALVVGYLAFTKVRPQRPVRIVGWTLCLAFVGHAPALWAWGQRYQSGLDLDFAKGRYTIEAPLVSPNGRYLYFTSRPPFSEQKVRFWVAVDLENGEVKRLGEGEGYLGWAQTLTYANFGRGTASSIQTPWAELGVAPDQRWVADTAEVGGSTHADVPYFNSEAFEEKYPNLWKDQRFRILCPVGFGFRMMLKPNPWFDNRQRPWIYDPFQNELTSWDEDQYAVCAVLRGAWLLRGSHVLDNEYFLYDPETKSISKAPRLFPKDLYLATLHGESLLLRRGTQLIEYNYRTNEERTVDEVGKQQYASGEPPVWYGARKLFGQAPIDESGIAWLLSHIDQQSIQIGRYDSLQNSVTWSPCIPREFQPIEVLPNQQILGISRYGVQNEKEQVQSFDWRTGQIETLFPRPAQ